jgi:hypothetical protein
MVLFIVLGFIVQIPSLGFYAQHFGRRFVKGKQSGIGSELIED